MTRILSWAFWLSIFGLAITVESWSSGVPVTVAIVAYIALMTGVAVRYSHE
mgnify:CR=1 FL=1